MYIKTSDQEVLDLGFGHCSCNWGAHICGLYETEAERDEIIMGFLHQGNVSGDLQLYCPAERGEQGFRQDYIRLYPPEAAHVDESNRFCLYDARVLYYPQGIFSPWAMDDGLNAFYANSQKNGRRNIRASAEMVWALEAIPGVEYLMAYEARLNLFIPGKPWVSICLYNISKFSGAMVLRVLQTHPYSISNGTMVENPFYILPEKWLADNAPQFLAR